MRGYMLSRVYRFYGAGLALAVNAVPTFTRGLGSLEKRRGVR